ncbi:MAG: sulfite exporter TauE/SafE family protein [Lishizhenia sp.]
MINVDELNYFVLGFFILLGTIAFAFSTIGGGGGALLMIPILNSIVGSAATPPLINLGNLIGRPSRVLLFWKDIHWKIVIYYAPTALIGAFLTAFLFSKVKLYYLQLAIALFLIGSFINFVSKRKTIQLNVKIWQFSILGFVISIIGTFVGGMGPVANPFYLNANIKKEEMIATKAMNSFIMGIAQVYGYTYFGVLNENLWYYGLSLGIGATLGNLIGKKLLRKMSDNRFKQFVYYVMLISGVLMLIKLFA